MSRAFAATVLLALAACGARSGGDVAAPLVLAPANRPAEEQRWLDAAELPALDGEGQWVLKLDTAGTIHRVRGGGELEPMNDRLSLPRRVLAIEVAGRALAALTDDGVRIVEPGRITRVALTGTALAASGRTIAVLDRDRVRVVDLADSRMREFLLEGARHVALTERAFLVAATDDAIFVENGSHELLRRWRADEHIGALVVRGEEIWFGDGERVGRLDAATSQLTRSLGFGDVVALSADRGEIHVVGKKGARTFGAQVEPAWPPDIERIVKSACGSCHRRGGEAPFSLGDAREISAHRDAARRVVASGAMPPDARTLAKADRAVLLSWLAR